jgi:hypothetical protein
LGPSNPLKWWLARPSRALARIPAQISDPDLAKQRQSQTMGANDTPLVAYEDRGRDGSLVADEPALGCYLGKVYLFWRRRHDYGYESSQYFDTSFQPTLDAAKAAIEEMRQQGSQWIIDELPAVVVFGKSTSLVIPARVEGALDGILPLATRPASLEHVAVMVGRGPLIDRLWCENGALPPARLPFFSRRSVGRDTETDLLNVPGVLSPIPAKYIAGDIEAADRFNRRWYREHLDTARLEGALRLVAAVNESLQLSH